jgi:hypothetical protein
MIGRTVWAVLLLVLSAYHLAQAWAGWQAPVTLILAVVVPIGLVALGTRLKVGAGAIIGVLAGLLALGTYLVTMSTDSGFLITLRDCVPRLLTAPRPVPATLDLLLPGVLLATIVSLAVARRVTREGRALVAPPTGATVLYVATALLTGGKADPYGLIATGLLLLIVGGWLLLDRPKGRRVAPGSAVTALVACAGIAVVAAVLPVMNGFEPRRLVNPPSQRLSEPSPLPRLAAWAQQGDVELMRVQGDPQLMRLVTLADFTGAYWRAGGVYRPLGSDEQALLPAGQRRAENSVNVLVSSLDGPWLPTAGDPSQISLADVAVDPDSGSTVVTGGLRAGLRYQVTSQQDDARPEDISAAGTPDNEAAAPYLATPSLPWQLSEYARQATRSASTPYEQAIALEDAVRSDRKVDASAPTGSSYARLMTFLLGGPGEPGAQTGTAEQFTAAFAMLARAVRLPTRVVVGFGPGDRAEDGTFVVRGRHATAWPEIYFEGWGWQRFQPTPSSDGTPGTLDAARQKVLAQLAARASTTIAAVPAQSTPRAAPPTKAAAAPPPGGPSATPGNNSLVFVAVIAGGLALPLLALAFARGFRRGRHRRGGSDGAWSELLDLLVLAGRPTRRSQAAPDIAAGLTTWLPVAAGNHAMRLALAADHAAFSPEPRRPDRRAWHEIRLLRRAIRGVVPWYRRMLWPFDPRPLRRR